MLCYHRAMNDSSAQSMTTMALIPNLAVCFNFVHEAMGLKKSAWLVPDVVRHRDDTPVISWRCSWGRICEADCLYATAKGRNRTSDGAAARTNSWSATENSLPSQKP